jgi:hypothetical protein
MRVFLRHLQTGYFYNGNLEWVAAQVDARHLPTIERALQVIIQDKLNHMSLVIRYDDSGVEQVFDLSDEQARALPTDSANDSDYLGL